jgi:hypothetical protein
MALPCSVLVGQPSFGADAGSAAPLLWGAKKSRRIIKSCGFLSVYYRFRVNRPRRDQPCVNRRSVRNKYARERRA